MLRDGYFIKEPLPRIGSHYIRDKFAREYTEDERFMQDVLLEKKPSHVNKVLTVLGRWLKI